MEHVLDCPVCGNKVDWFDICDHCGWHNSGPGERKDGPKGPNRITLREAIEAYKSGNEIE